jgi:hypothetical protein
MPTVQAPLSVAIVALLATSVAASLLDWGRPLINVCSRFNRLQCPVGWSIRQGARTPVDLWSQALSIRGLPAGGHASAMFPLKRCTPAETEASRPRIGYPLGVRINEVPPSRQRPWTWQHLFVCSCRVPYGRRGRLCHRTCCVMSCSISLLHRPSRKRSAA